MNVPQIAQFRTSMECVLIDNDLKEYINIDGMDLNLIGLSHVTQNVLSILLLYFYTYKTFIPRNSHNYNAKNNHQKDFYFLIGTRGIRKLNCF
jgi:hypothetical protein